MHSSVEAWNGRVSEQVSRRASERQRWRDQKREKKSGGMNVDWNAIHRFLPREQSSPGAYNSSKCNVNDICSNIFIRAVANGTKCSYARLVHELCVYVFFLLFYRFPFFSKLWCTRWQPVCCILCLPLTFFTLVLRNSLVFPSRLLPHFTWWIFFSFVPPLSFPHSLSPVAHFLFATGIQCAIITPF